MRFDTRVLRVERVTAFQRRVFEAVCRIPEGQVSTYGAVAKAIGCGSSRAVGQAMRRSPGMPEVPCHRVVAGDLSLGGFFGESGGLELARKRRMLEREGVTFDAKGRVTSKVFLFWKSPAAPRIRTGGTAKGAARLGVSFVPTGGG